MPCKCDYLEPNERERESKKVGILLRYVLQKLGRHVPSSVLTAAMSECGFVTRVDEHTKMLCDLCQNLTDKEKKRIFNIKEQDGRDVASWWFSHQEMDAKRIAREKHEKKLANAKIRALKKLTPLEREALGFASK